jgi:hypothetical protein
MATVIASQAVISGAFSITLQAMQLGYLPRFAVRHTSESEMGQIYLPAINWLLLAAVIALVLGFGFVEQSRRGLRHRGDRHHADHQPAGLCRRAQLWGWRSGRRSVHPAVRA